MTVQEAIKTLRVIRDAINRGDWIQSNDAEALDMAIEALQQSCEKVAEGCDDLISRSDAVNAIYHHLTGWTMDECRMMLHEVPSAQPEIIRCGECKWYGRTDKRRFYRGMDCLNKHIDTIIPDRDFCSRAERKDDE